MWSRVATGFLLLASLFVSLTPNYMQPVDSSKFSEYGVVGKVLPSETGTLVFQIQYEDRMFNITITGEGITSLAFSQEEKVITLLNNQTKGVLEVVIPKELLDGEFTIVAGGKKIEFDLSETDTHTTLLFDVPTDSESIIVQGTTVVPEFPVVMLVLLATTSLGILFAVLNQRRLR
jgi:hypothetical protein